MWSLFQGMVALGIVFAIFVVALNVGVAEDEVRALAFFSLILTIIALIFVNRSYGSSVLTALRRPNRALFVVLPGVVLMLAVTLLWPYANQLFRFGALNWEDLLISGGAGVAVLIGLEVIKPAWRQRQKTKSS